MSNTILKQGYLLLFLCFSFFCNAQSTLDSSSTIQLDTTSLAKIDTAKKESREWSRPEKAALFSAIFPGLGQAYNKKYLKMPIIYLAEGALLYGVFYSHSQYRIARDVLNNNSTISVLDTTFIANQRIVGEGNYRTVRDRQRRNRDSYTIIFSLVYGLNIVDAIVDAHLAEFDLSNDLSLKIKPNVSAINNTFAAGLTFNFKLK